VIYRAPFPWFGGKSRAAPLIWERLGDVNNYVEPFFGSGAILLGRPHGAHGIETVNDLDGFVCNAWRSIQADPDRTAQYADWPVNENDLHARHVWLSARRAELSRRLEGNPDYYDAQIAGWWLWGMACWIGHGFCAPTGNGPWGVVDGQLVRLGPGRGVSRQLVHLGNAGQGVNRKSVHLGQGQGVDANRGLITWFRALQARLRHVRVCCGDWTRVLGPTPTTKLGLTGIVLDPPYGEVTGRDMAIYALDSGDVAAAVRAWAVAHGQDPRLRIVLCGYAGEHEMPDDWTRVQWTTRGGYANTGHGQGRERAARETLWCSPHCLAPSNNLLGGKSNE
jgi:hypothetical protein